MGRASERACEPVIGKNAEQIVKRIRETPPGEKAWQLVQESADIHGYRTEYATAIYKDHSREIKDIPYDRTTRGTWRRYQSEVYVCRKDEAGAEAAVRISVWLLGGQLSAYEGDGYYSAGNAGAAVLILVRHFMG